ALALVREGRLQEATDMLMGHNKVPVGATTPPPPVPSQAKHRFSSLAARGLAGVQDVLDKLDLQPGQVPMGPASAEAGQAAWTNRSSHDTQTAAPNASEPGRFERVAFTHNGVNHTYALYTPQTAAPANGRPLVMML